MADDVVLDHLVYCAPDLASGVRWFAEVTGVEPVVGGRHLGYGTANYLVGLGEGRYLEIIGVDPDAPQPPGRRLFGLGPAGPIGLVTWAVRTGDVDQAVRAARDAGYDPGEPVAMSRRTTEDRVLRWRLTPDTVEATGGLVPFLIDWGSATHPTARGLPEVGLASLTLQGPDPAYVGRCLAALGVRQAVQPAAKPAMRAVLATPRGPVTLG